MQNPSVFSLEIVIFALVSLEKIRKSLNSSISLVIIITNLKLVLQNFLGSPYFFKTYIIGDFKLLKLVKIDKNKNFMLISFKVVKLS